LGKNRKSSIYEKSSANKTFIPISIEMFGEIVSLLVSESTYVSFKDYLSISKLMKTIDKENIWIILMM
jgi:hypothetical protein